MTAFTQLAQAARLAREALQAVTFTERTAMDDNGAATVPFCTLKRCAEAISTLDAALAAAQAIAEPEPAAFLRMLDDAMSDCRREFDKRAAMVGNRPNRDWELWQMAWLRSRATSPPAPALAEVASGPTHRHLRRGGLYTELHRGFLQTDVPLTDMMELVAYRGEDGRVWFRPVSEFDDDERFAALATPTQPLPTAVAIEQTQQSVQSELLVLLQAMEDATYKTRGMGFWIAIKRARELLAAPTHPAPVLANGLTEAALTDEAIHKLAKAHGTRDKYLAFARAIEAAIRTEGAK